MKVYIDINYTEHRISICKTLFRRRFKTLCGIKIFQDFAIQDQKDLSAKTKKLKKPCVKCNKISTIRTIKSDSGTVTGGVKYNSAITESMKQKLTGNRSLFSLGQNFERFF